MARHEQLRVNEIFHSIQGEGTRAGRRCVFIRLTGCHLRCTYCDTEYAFHEGRWMSFDAILERVRSYNCPFVELTGGEPLLQPNVYALMDRLCLEFATVAIETSGAVSIERVNARVVRIVDFKTPSSGECARNVWENVELLTGRDEVKFVIGDRADYDWSRDVVERFELCRRCPVLFSPVFGCRDASTLQLHKGRLDSRELAEWLLADRLNVRFAAQLHKHIWTPEMRGV